MPNRPTHIIEELLAAARGTVAVALGDRRAPAYFDFTPRGLAGSFIAFLVATTFSAFLPASGGTADNSLPIGRLLLMAGVLIAAQLAFSALVLRQLKRLDGFVPYMVADNWATFFVTVLSALLTFMGLSSDIALVVLAILVLVIEINIARLIVTLKPWQVVLLLVAQVVGACVGVAVIDILLPLPPDTLALTPQ